VEYVQSTHNAVLAGPSPTEDKRSCTYTFPADVNPVLGNGMVPITNNRVNINCTALSAATALQLLNRSRV